jgi:putative addiction module component (TIGR02574 family)
MTRPLREIEDEALSLPQAARAALVERLLATLDTAESVDVEDAWLAEAEKRYDAYRSGKIEARPARDALARARKELT